MKVGPGLFPDVVEVIEINPHRIHDMSLAQIVVNLEGQIRIFDERGYGIYATSVWTRDNFLNLQIS